MDSIEDWEDDVEKGGGFFRNASEAPRSAAAAASSVVPTAWEVPAEGFIAEKRQYGGDIRGARGRKYCACSKMQFGCRIEEIGRAA